MRPRDPIAGGTLTAAMVRAYANLPPEVPEALLERHIGIAARDLARATGLMGAPENKTAAWAKALDLCARSPAHFPG